VRVSQHIVSYKLISEHILRPYSRFQPISDGFGYILDNKKARPKKRTGFLLPI